MQPLVMVQFPIQDHVVQVGVGQAVQQACCGGAAGVVWLWQWHFQGWGAVWWTMAVFAIGGALRRDPLEWYLWVWRASPAVAAGGVVGVGGGPASTQAGVRCGYLHHHQHYACVVVVVVVLVVGLAVWSTVDHHAAA